MYTQTYIRYFGKLAFAQHFTAQTSPWFIAHSNMWSNRIVEKYTRSARINSHRRGKKSFIWQILRNRSIGGKFHWGNMPTRRSLWWMAAVAVPLICAQERTSCTSWTESGCDGDRGREDRSNWALHLPPWGCEFGIDASDASLLLLCDLDGCVCIESGRQTRTLDYEWQVPLCRVCQYREKLTEHTHTRC